MTAPNGGTVVIRAVPSGYAVRELVDGSGTMSGLALEVAARALQWAGAQTYGRNRWTVAVVSGDLGPWRGEQRFALRRRVPDGDVPRVMDDLAHEAESGRVRIPPRRRTRRKRRKSEGQCARSR